MNLRILISLLRNAQVKTFKKGDLLIQQGSVAKDVFYIKKGIVRSYLTDEQGEEITFQLYAEGNVFTNAHSVLLSEKSKFSYQTLDDSKVYVISYDSIMSLTLKNTKLLTLIRNFFAKRIIQQAFQRAETFVFLSPEERYQKFVKDNPDLIHRVQDKYIAHVLGITPVSLSRIKNRVAKKK